MSKGDILRAMDYLGHIVESIDRIHRYVDDMTELTFLEDEKTQDAVIRNFEILDEAAHNVELHHAAFAAAHPEVPWPLMYTLRNRVAHGYFKVDFELIWFEKSNVSRQTLAATIVRRYFEKLEDQLVLGVPRLAPTCCWY